MDTSASSYVTIPASGSSASGQAASKVDPDADTSSTKTEVEEMELDTFSDLEDNMRAHENVSLKFGAKTEIQNVFVKMHCVQIVITFSVKSMARKLKIPIFFVKLHFAI